MTAEKPKFQRLVAIEAAKEILAGFVSNRVVIAGSLRRGRATVGDIEILYIPAIETRQDANELFEKKIQVNLSDVSINSLIQSETIRPRENTLGATTWGEKNKLAIHIKTGIPVDFFATTESAWWNYLTCRTGPAENNVKIASAAQSKGWKWHPYGDGFTDEHGTSIRVSNEREAFTLVGIPYREPHER